MDNNGSTYQKRKVLFVIDSLSSGGAEKSLVTALNLLDKDKYEIHLLTFKKGGLYESLVPKEVVRVSPPPYIQYLFGEAQNLSFLQKIQFFLFRIFTGIGLRVASLIKKINTKAKLHPAQVGWFFNKNVISEYSGEYDAAIAYSQGMPTYFVSKKVNASTKSCWINTHYGQAGYSASFDKQYYQNFFQITLVSEKSKEVFVKHHPYFAEKTDVIYDILSEQVVIKMAQEPGGFDDNFDGIRILTVGRLVPPKGYDIAIKASKILKDKGIKFRWYAIGEGVLKEALEKLIVLEGLQKDEDFVFLGTYPNPYPFIDQCDIYCQPSRFEGFGLAVAEARILNRPIVATNFEIIYNQLVHGENGVITDMNAKAVSEGIERIVNDADFKNQLIQNLEKEVISNEEEVLKIERLLDN